MFSTDKGLILVLLRIIFCKIKLLFNPILLSSLETLPITNLYNPNPISTHTSLYLSQLLNKQTLTQPVWLTRVTKSNNKQTRKSVFAQFKFLFRIETGGNKISKIISLTPYASANSFN